MCICRFSHSFGVLLLKSSFEWRWTNYPTHQVKQELFWHSLTKGTLRLMGNGVPNLMDYREERAGNWSLTAPSAHVQFSSLFARSLVSSFARQIIPEPPGLRIAQWGVLHEGCALQVRTWYGGGFCWAWGRFCAHTWWKQKLGRIPRRLRPCIALVPESGLPLPLKKAKWQSSLATDLQVPRRG